MATMTRIDVEDTMILTDGATMLIPIAVALVPTTATIVMTEGGDMPDLQSGKLGEDQAKFSYAVYRGTAHDNKKIKHWDDLPQETRDMLTAMAAVQMGQK